MPKRAAVIDLGSNTARVIVIQFQERHSYHLEDEIREVVRLREGLTDEGLHQEAVQRALSTLRLFARFCEAVEADLIIAVATSAVREASNRNAFLQQVRRKTGLKLTVLSQEEEAFYGALGALNCIPITDGVVMDTGGGSVQLSVIRKGQFKKGLALTLGALALTEQFIRSDPARRKEIKEIQDEIQRQLDQVPWWEEASGLLAGLGGTVRNLAKIEARRKSFPLNSINGFLLSRQSVDQTIELLKDLPLKERRKIPGLSVDRADIILPGAMVVQAVMERLEAQQLTISTYGVREGLFLERFWGRVPLPGSADLRSFSVRNMARFYNYHEVHAQHVRFLSLKLFDQLKPLHGLGADERELLDAAALLHDIGTVIHYNDHHKHSQMLISSNGLPGFSPRETALIALLTRYHRKGMPGVDEYSSLLKKGDSARLEKLCALLRLAECLERGRRGFIRDVQASWDPRELTLKLVADGEPAVEIWAARRQASELMQKAFERAIRFQLSPA